jgi:hypothetical protein
MYEIPEDRIREDRIRDLNHETLAKVNELYKRTLHYNLGEFPGFMSFVLRVLGIGGLVIATLGRAKASDGKLPDFATVESVSFILGSVILLVYGLYMRLCQYKEQMRFSTEVLKTGVQIFDKTLQQEVVGASLRKSSTEKA